MPLTDFLFDTLFMSYQEKILDDLLKNLVLIVCNKTKKNIFTETYDIDFIIENENYLYIVNICSSFNKEDDSLLEKYKYNLLNVKEKLQNKTVKKIIMVNASCLGNGSILNQKEGYYELYGKDFWELISEDANIYSNLVMPICFKAKNISETIYSQENGKKKNVLIVEFLERFCTKNSDINWESLIQLNSGKKE